ncbi:type VII secretion-associated serine protease mycosin [Streptomyces thermoviolaceus]|uniref:type VII secretion-associated serine protease mycosin n=1 Tax=Streptomyces thermoviolaceus TaxID=1952 RepID=UPI00203A3DCB|nr:type VII secretion-associated serine protease mycosin [Streptomyces thermoviolaceus]MCM3264578.1 type VII secretion-associated serine protease mycosin [Streptomyces thermoviolaceus]
MRNGKRRLRHRSAASALLGLMLAAVGTTPAHAESVRARQWHLDAMHADEMWKISTGRGITVAVIDSGVDDSVADLKGQVLDGKDYAHQRGDEHTDVANHGTGIAALIAGTGARGPVNGSYGLAPGAKILPIRMRYTTEDYGEDDAGTEYSHVLSQAIRYAADSQARIINMSIALPDTPGRHDVGTPELASAVKYALSKGKLLFAGVGNTGDKGNQIMYPAATPGVVGVGAVDEHVRVAAFSQQGPEVDLVAPGVNMIHACTGGSELCKGDGTSDATAIASASAALIWSRHPDWTNNQVLRVMLNTASKGTSGEERTDSFGYGVVRPRIALTDPGDPGPPDVYPLPDLVAASQSASPQATESTGSEASQQHHTPPKTAAEKNKDSSKTPLWIGLGIAAAALLGTAIAVPLLRARRRSTLTPATPPTPPLPHQPYTPHPRHSEAHPPYVPPSDSQPSK